jgi:hypothetical protein
VVENPSPSVATTEKLTDPDEVGVPDRTPVEESWRPAGRLLPDASPKVAVPTPPLKLSAAVYGSPDVVPGRLGGVTTKDAGATARLVATDAP